MSPTESTEKPEELRAGWVGIAYMDAWSQLVMKRPEDDVHWIYEIPRLGIDEVAPDETLSIDRVETR